MRRLPRGPEARGGDLRPGRRRPGARACSASTATAPNWSATRALKAAGELDTASDARFQIAAAVRAGQPAAARHAESRARASARPTRQTGPAQIRGPSAGTRKSPRGTRCSGSPPVLSDTPADARGEHARANMADGDSRRRTAAARSRGCRLSCRARSTHAILMAIDPAIVDRRAASSASLSARSSAGLAARPAHTPPPDRARKDRAVHAERLKAYQDAEATLREAFQALSADALKTNNEAFLASRRNAPARGAHRGRPPTSTRARRRSRICSRRWRRRSSRSIARSRTPSAGASRAARS